MNTILLAIFLTAAAIPFEVQTLDGQTFVGPLVELTADRLTIDTAGGRMSLDTERLLSLSSQQKTTAKSSAGLVVRLADGSSIVARQYVSQGVRAKLTLTNGETLEIPTSIVCTVQLQQESSALNAEWERLVDKKVDGDLLVIRKGLNIDYHRGIIHEVTQSEVRFELDGEVLPVKRSKVFGFAYRHVEATPLSAAVCRLTDSTGSQWAVRSLELAENLQWTTPAGLARARPANEVVQIDFSGGRIVYLSDLTPDKVHWTPYFHAGKPPAAVQQFFAPRYDRSFESAILQLGGTQYRKGLALHSRTEIVYRLPDGFNRFRAMVGIDDAVRPGGKVRLLIRGDEKDMLDAVLAGSDAPRPVDLDLTDVRRLTVVVDFGDSLSAGDYLLLCNARLSK